MSRRAFIIDLFPFVVMMQPFKVIHGELLVMFAVGLRENAFDRGARRLFRSYHDVRNNVQKFHSERTFYDDRQVRRVICRNDYDT